MNVLKLIFFIFLSLSISFGGEIAKKDEYKSKTLYQMINDFTKSTGIYVLFISNEKAKVYDKDLNQFNGGIAKLIMISICLFLIYLAIAKNFEPLLLIPIGFGVLAS